MIVHDESTLQEALQLLESRGLVRYSDEYAYIIITTPGTLELLCRRAFNRNDIAIVVPRGEEQTMEDHSRERPGVRRRRARDEKKAIRAWVREHPEQVQKIEKVLKRGKE